MASTPESEDELENHLLADGPLPAFVEWLIGAIIALGGLLAVLGGSAMAFLVDREMIQQEIEREAMTVRLMTTELSDAEAATVADTVLTWVGIGLFLVGAGMVVFAVGYIAYRYRKRRRYADDARRVPAYGTNALIGALVASLLSFIPFATVLGGLVAGYLERIDSERTVSVGALSGVLPVVPILAIVAFLFVGLADGLMAVGESGFAWFAAIAVLFAALFALIVAGGLGAIGGYVGGWLAERSAERQGRAEPN